MTKSKKTKKVPRIAVLHEDVWGNVTNLGTVHTYEQADERVRKFKRKRGEFF